MILALGGNGFIGRNFVKRFAQIEKVRVFGQNKKYEVKNSNVEYIKGDFRNVRFHNLLENVDTVFHFISSTVPFEGTEGILEDIECNVIPTIKLLEAMKEIGCKKIFFVSSGGTIYGECNSPATENTKLSPECVYAVQKQSIENYLHLYEKYNDIQGYILRVSNPYGLDVNKNKKQGIIPIFTQKILKGDAIEVWGTGENRRDYIYIDEVIDAIESVYQYSGMSRIFNIGTGISHSIREIIDVIEKETKLKAKIEFKEGRKCDLINSFLDTSLIYQECGWKSKMSIEQGIRDYVDIISNKMQIGDRYEMGE